MDVDNIPLGENFASVIKSEVQKCQFFLSVIGPNWLNLTDEENKRRLDDPGDFVRIETIAALKAKLRVIPVLVSEAEMPSRVALPRGMKTLNSMQALRLNHETFHSDLNKLVKEIRAFEDSENGANTAQTVSPVNEIVGSKISTQSHELPTTFVGENITGATSVTPNNRRRNLWLEVLASAAILLCALAFAYHQSSGNFLETFKRAQSTLCVSATGRYDVRTREAFRIWETMVEQEPIPGLVKNGQLDRAEAEILTTAPSCAQDFQNYQERDIFTNRLEMVTLRALKRIMLESAARLNATGSPVQLRLPETVTSLDQLRPSIAMLKRAMGIAETAPNKKYLNFQITPDFYKLL